MGSWSVPCLPTNPCGPLVKQCGAGHFFRQHAGSIRRQKQPSLNQHPSVLPLGLDDLTTSPCWQETSPLSQGLLLAGEQEHSNLRRAQLPPPVPRKARRKKKNSSSHPRGQRAWGNPPRVDIGMHREMSWKAAENIWPVMSSVQFWEKRQISIVGS